MSERPKSGSGVIAKKALRGLYDRSSRPLHCPHQSSAHRHQEIVRLRRLRRTYRQISRQLGVSQSTVGRVLPKLGLNRLSALEPAQPVNRYQHEHPGDLLHLDIKKHGRFKRPGHRVTGNRQQNSRHSGWEYVHVAIDDVSWNHPQAHQTLHTAYQRQGRAVHPDCVA